MLYYTSDSNHTEHRRRLINAHVTNRSRQLGAQGCHVIVKNSDVKKSRDAHDVNLVMMDAYLVDGVDFFLLVFPRRGATSFRDLQRLPSRSLS